MSPAIATSNPQQTIVVIGLSGAGLKAFNALLNKLYPLKSNKPLVDGLRVIVIEKGSCAYWAIGSLRAAVVPGFEEQVVRDFEHVIPARIKKNCDEQVKVVTGREVVRLDLDNRIVHLNESLAPFGLEDSEQLNFDYLVIGSGSSYPFPCRPPPGVDSPAAVKSRLQELQKDVEQSESILIVGSGVVGIEFAGELSSQYKNKQITLVGSNAELLSEWSKNLSNSIVQQLSDRGVKIVYKHRVDLDEHGIKSTTKLEKKTTFTLNPVDGSTDKQTVEADFVFMATGNKANTGFVPSTYLNPNNHRIKVDKHLQVIDPTSSEPLPGVYAIGDVIDFEDGQLFSALDAQASTVSTNLIKDITSDTTSKVDHKPMLGTIVIPLGPCGGGSQIFGFTFGLGACATSVIKGRTLFLSVFKSMYPTKDR